MSSKPQHPLKEDLRRMAPVMAIVLLTAWGVVLMMYWTAERHLHAIVAGNPNSCSVAEIFITRGYALLPRLRIDLHEERIAADRVGQSSLGEGANDPRVEEAREHFQRAFRLCPSNPYSLYALSVLEWYAGNEALSRAHLARYFLANREIPSAAAQVRIAKELDPTLSETLVVQALLLTEEGRFEEALAFVEQYGEVFEVSTQARFAKATVLSRLGQDAEALTLFQQAFLEQPSFTPALYIMAESARRLSRQEEIANFIMSLEDVERPLSHANYSVAAGLFRDAGDFRAEERALRRSLRLFPNNPRTNFELAVNAHRQGQRSRARDWLQSALEYNAAMTRSWLNELDFEPGES